MNIEEKKYRLSLIMSMIIFGTIGIFRRYIPLPSATLAMLRGYIGMLFLVIFIIVKREKTSWINIRKNLVLLIVSGALIGFNWILLFEAYKYTTVSTATLCYYMAPIFVILAVPIFFKEKITINKLMCICIAIIGMVLVSGVLKSGLGNIKGILLGLGAACFYASVIILNKKIKNISAYDKTIFQLLAAAVVITPYSFVFEDISLGKIKPIIIVMVLIVGILHTGIAYVLYFGSIKVLKAQTVAIFSYMDPIISIILSSIMLKERMGLIEILGAIIILGATMLSEVLDFKDL